MTSNPKRKFSAAVFGMVIFVNLYANATMNAVTDRYLPGFDSIKGAFAALNFIVLMVSVLCLMVCVAWRKFRNASQAWLKALGTVLLLVSVAVFALGYAPCLTSRALEMQQSSQRTLFSVVKQSLLCPQYSNRSYIDIFLFASVALAMLALAQRKKPAGGDNGEA